jgi:hypothetical protein
MMTQAHNQNENNFGRNEIGAKNSNSIISHFKL